MSDDDEPNAPGRSRALSAVIELAIQEAADDSGSSRSWGYRPDIETSEVAKAAEGDVSDRTTRRACKDAAELDWIEQKTQGWDVGDRARELAPDSTDEKVTVCWDCEAVFEGLTSHCGECGSEAIHQVEPADPERSPI